MKLPLAAACLLLAATRFASATPDATALAEGRAFAEDNCARCHAVTETDASPNPRSIPFRFLGKLYPIEGLEEALAEGIYASHEMPEFELTPEQITALIQYLESIQVRSQ